MPVINEFIVAAFMLAITACRPTTIGIAVAAYFEMKRAVLRNDPMAAEIEQFETGTSSFGLPFSGSRLVAEQGFSFGAPFSSCGYLNKACFCTL